MSTEGNTEGRKKGNTEGRKHGRKEGWTKKRKEENRIGRMTEEQKQGRHINVGGKEG